MLIQKDEYAIVIDPGSDFLDSHSVSELSGVRAVLYTHQHGDHYNPTIAQALLKNGAELICNASTAGLIDGVCRVVTDNESFELFGFRITARELPHMFLPDGSAGPQNTGYVIDDILFHPGDGKDINKLLIKTLAVPITGPDISMKEAFDFAKKVKAKKVIPIHYDKLGAKPDVYRHFAERLHMPFQVIVLEDGDTTEL